MKPLKPIVFIALLYLTACASSPPNYVWMQQGKTENDYFKSKTDCEAKRGAARMAEPTYGDKATHNTYLDQCLKGEGWTLMEETTTTDPKPNTSRKSSP